MSYENDEINRLENYFLLSWGGINRSLLVFGIFFEWGRLFFGILFRIYEEFDLYVFFFRDVFLVIVVVIREEWLLLVVWDRIGEFKRNEVLGSFLIGGGNKGEIFCDCWFNDVVDL